MGFADNFLPTRQYAEDETVRNAAAPASSIPANHRKSLDELVRMLNEFRSTTETNTTQGQIDYDYYDGIQLTESEKAALNDRGQPDIIVNRTRVAINGILGIIAHQHTDPKAWPRTQEDSDSASVASDVLRYVTSKNHFNSIKVLCAKDNFIGGACAVMVGVDPNKNVPLTQIRWEELIYDTRSRQVNFSDARYMGIGKWMFYDDVQDRYKGKAPSIEGELGTTIGMVGAGDDFMGDRPLNQGWLDTRNRRIFVVEMYYRCGKIWYKTVYWAGGVLEEGVSPYKDENGIPSCPIEAVACYIDRQNNRYGLIRDMRPLQDEINKRRSKLLHLVNSSQIEASDPSAIEVNADEARREAARPDGVLPYGWKKVSTSDMAQGQMLLLTEAKNEMERFGPNPAVLGRQGADTSGRALLARQQAGMIELAVILDQMEDWELRVYKAIWARVKQYWKAPQFIRVTDDVDDPKFVGINQPIPHPNAGQPVMAPVPHPEGGLAEDPNNPGQALMAPQMQNIPHPMDPTQQMQVPVMHPDILGYKNSMAETDVDIVIDTTPATATVMAEQLDSLMKLVSSNPAYAAQVPFEIFLDLMPLPRKRQLIQQIKTFREQAQQQQSQMQEQQMSQMAQKIMSEIRKNMTQADLNTAAANLDIAKTGIIPGQERRQDMNTNIQAVDTAHSIARDHATALHGMVSDDEAGEREAAAAKAEPSTTE